MISVTSINSDAFHFLHDRKLVLKLKNFKDEKNIYKTTIEKEENCIRNSVQKKST